MNRPVNISEQAIEKYGRKRIATWAYLRLRNPNGVVFGGYDQQRAAKTDWSRSTFFSRMAGLVESGLARKDQWGNWSLAKVDSISQGHKCTLLLNDGISERDVEDVVLLKLFEQGHRQMVFELKHSDTAKAMSGVSGAKFGSAKTGIREIGGMHLDLGADRRDTVKLAISNYEAPLNTKSLERMTGLGRSALFAWKRRAKQARWIVQRDRCAPLPIQDPVHVLMGMDDMEAVLRGRISYSSSLGMFVLNRASSYQLGVSYLKSK